MSDATLRLFKIAPPVGDETLNAFGTIAFPIESFDPLQRPVTFSVADQRGHELLGAQLPPIAYARDARRGWKVDYVRAKFHFIDRRAEVPRAEMKVRQNPLTNGFSVTVRLWLHAIGSDIRHLPLRLRLTWGADACARWIFPGPPGFAPACELDGRGNFLSCR